MPRISSATKDVTSCEKPSGGANNRYNTRISEWDNPIETKVGKPAELKHLSRRRKRKSNRFPE